MSYFVNRELSWLKFNKRVLEEASAVTVPLFEKLQFISIFTSNLDEFFMVRAGSLYDRSLLENGMPDNKTGMTAGEQLEAIYSDARPLYAQRDKYYLDVTSQLKSAGICYVGVKDLDTVQQRYIKQYFRHDILPLVSPQIIDAKHPFPHLENKNMYIFAYLEKNDKKCYGLIPVSNTFKRLVFLESQTSISYMLVEDILLKYAKEIFKQYKVISRTVVRVTRNADIEVEDNFSDDDIDYRDYVKEIIKKREKLAPVRLETYSGSFAVNTKLHKRLREFIGLEQTRVFHSLAPIDMSYVGELEDKLVFTHGAKTPLLYKPMFPQQPKDISPTASITALAEKRDIFLSYPYYTMRTYLNLLKEAADDVNTVSIKITLYRLSRNSEVIRLLCEAAENGHEVTVLVELKARFDENNNINWSRRLEEAGCHVIYGLDGLKVHSKITLITRKNDDRIRYITHIATGNYNEKTAKLYTDVGVITSDPGICEDAVEFFKNMTLGISDGEYKHLLVAPSCLKNNIISLIRSEQNYICFKMNSMTDKEIIDELVAASGRGVKIDLIIRGICCLLPNIRGVTDNIRVISIVGRFLEHSRIFIFGNDDKRKVFIGSADLMTRNTSRRIEIIAPVLDASIADELYSMTRVMLSDNVKSSLLCSNGSYERAFTDEAPLDSQIYFYEKAYKNN